MSFKTNLQNTIAQIANDIVELRERAGTLSNLTTADKASLVAAINELQVEINAIDVSSVINDASTTSTTQTYSIDKIKDSISAAIADLVDGAPTALDTLNELAVALQDNDSELASLTTTLDNRVSYTAQTKTALEKETARNNIGAAAIADIVKDDEGLLLSQPYANLDTSQGEKQSAFNSKVDAFVGGTKSFMTAAGDLSYDFLSAYNTAAGNV